MYAPSLVIYNNNNATSSQVSSRVTYNGHAMDEFVPARTAAYISQHDLHISQMTVRETLAFVACCQGVGFRFGIGMNNIIISANIINYTYICVTHCGPISGHAPMPRVTVLEPSDLSSCMNLQRSFSIWKLVNPLICSLHVSFPLLLVPLPITKRK
jgi:hypothetical protein